MKDGDYLGPALTEVAPNDGEALRALFAEQRARLAVVRDNAIWGSGIWEWLGGVPSGFGPPKAPLHGLYLQFASIVLVFVALIVAGFTRGPWLWGIVALAAACLLLRELLVGGSTRKTLRFYRRAVQAPAMLIAVAPAKDPSLEHARCAAALVALGDLDAAALQQLAAAADRLRRMVDGAEPVPDELAPLVASVRGGMEARIDDGSRVVVPAPLGPGRYELARLLVPLPLLPDEELASRLVFVLCDPDERAAAHTRIVQSSVWGNGVERLCDAFPMEGGA